MKDVPKKVVIILTVIYFFVLIFQAATLIIMTGKATNIGEASLIILLAPISVHAPFNLTANLNPDGSSIDINWSNISEAQHYNIYYSSNLSQIRDLDPNNLGPDVIAVSGITDTNWTDCNASRNKTRYYTVSAARNSLINVSKEAVGKCELDLVKGNNMISLCLNRSYTAESFLEPINSTQYIPSIIKLDRPSQTVESWIAHAKGYGADYNLELGKGYITTLDHNMSYIVTGHIFYDVFTLKLIKGNNLIGIDGNRTYTAESFLEPINSTQYLPSIIKLDRPSQTAESWIAHAKGYGTDYAMYVGKGYILTLDHNMSYTLR